MTIKSDSRHLYLQVIDRLKDDIEKGIYKEREKLPSEFDLAKQLGISRATLREALRILEEENIVIRRHGVGTFVNSKPLFTSGIEHLSSVTNMIMQAGKSPGTIFLSSSEQEASEEDVKRFQCSINDEILLVERVRTADGEPVVYCIDKIPNQYIPNGYSLDEQSLFKWLEKQGRYISHAIVHIEPLGYHERISPILQCEPETALLLLKQTHYDQQDKPVLFSLNYFRADKFSFHVLRKRV